MNIIAELNGTQIETQQKDIEIERLRTTCQTLNTKLSVLSDYQKDNEIL